MPIYDIGHYEHGYYDGSQFRTGAIPRTPRQLVTIDGEPVLVYSIETQHGIKRPIGTCTVRMPMPAADERELRDRWLNRTIEAMAGYDEDGGAQRIFAGRIDRLSRSFDKGGYRLEVRASGWSSLLDWPSERDIVFPGGTELYEIARSLCESRRLPMYGGERITYPNSATPVKLGGVTDVDDGQIIIKKRSSPLQWLTNTLQLFGYYGHDRPSGMFWWGRVMGRPVSAAVETFEQGRNVFAMSREDDLTKMVTWWDIEGASYTDADGVPVKVRSFPASVPFDYLLDPPGWRRDSKRDAVLITNPLADAARNVAEIDTAAPYEAESWRYIGNPAIQPGDVVALDSELLELASGKRWVMSVDHSSSDRGIRTSWTGWQGAGRAAAPGDDSVRIAVFSGPRHVGDEYLNHYAQKSPQGKELSFTVTIPADYTAVVLEGWAHGVNSQRVDGKNTEDKVSKIEVWQASDKERASGSAVLPSMPENLSKRYPYGAANWQKYWTRFRLPLPGRLEPGTATVKLISGKAAGYDDYEVRDLVIVLTGIGYPSLPGGVV